MKILFLSLLVAQSAFAGMPSKREQFNISLRKVIENATRPDVRPGMIVASPSRSNPDYYFDWVRDTALTMRAMIDYYELKKDPRVKKLIFTWIDAEAYRQNLPTLSGLGEPKYNIDGSGFTGPWGRPQNDGPALRAIAMIKFARILLKEGEHDYVIRKLYSGVIPADSVIKKDLEYTAHHWREPGFDLWEEEKGMHFYTLMAQHTALQEGALLAKELRDGGAAQFYSTQSRNIASRLRSEYIDSQVGIAASRHRQKGLWYKTSNLDVAPLLALIHNHPYQRVFNLNEPAVKKYVQVLTSKFGEIYSINKAFPELGVGIGRYPEDRYDGYGSEGRGNPWFLATLGLGEYYCLASNARRTNTQTEKQFARALFHSDRRGQMSEQFNQDTGNMQGAHNLTWSYNAFMTAMMRCGQI